MRWSGARALVGAASLAAGVLVMGVAVPASADAVSDPATQDELTAEMDTLRYQVKLDEAAGDVQIQNDGTIVQTIDEQQMVLEQDGSWTINDVPTEGQITPQFVSGCAGSFGDVLRVRNYLQGSATQTCTEGAYPQWIHYQLRSTCAGPLCIIFSNETGRIRSNNGLGYSRVANVTYTEDCESSGNRKYSQIVWPAGKGVEFGPVVDRDEPIVGCDLNA